MPAMLDDPTAPTIFRTSGVAPYPDPHHPSIPTDVLPRQVILRDRVTVATIVPFSSKDQVPASLLAHLSDQLNKEIELGDTYPMIDGLPVERFGTYWFQNFAAIMLVGNIDSPKDVVEGRDWSTECLGSFYIKPNYPGRSSHVCNAGFLVTPASRNRGVGRLMGEAYLEWAPKLGYSYSVFNLVYETNVASCRIWDGLGFKRIGRVPGCGNLRSSPGRLIDAIIYGRELGSDNAELVSEERFEKIKFYLKTGKYPHGADRAEKSRLRSAATHYKLLPGPDSSLNDSGSGDKLMLKGKEVISDAQQQYEIARRVHLIQHGGINKTTTAIAERFHWTRIKETVNLVIKNCLECKEMGKVPIIRGIDADVRSASQLSAVSVAGLSPPRPPSLATTQRSQSPEQFDDPFHDPSVSTSNSLSHPLHGNSTASPSIHTQHAVHPHHFQHTPLPSIHVDSIHERHPHRAHLSDTNPEDYIDPQIMEDVDSHLRPFGTRHAGRLNRESSNDDDSQFTPSHDHADAFHAMLQHHEQHGDGSSQTQDQESGVIDQDLDMMLNDAEEDDSAMDDSRTTGQDDAKVRAQAAAQAAEAAMRDQISIQGKSQSARHAYNTG